MLPKLRCIVILLISIWSIPTQAFQFIEPQPEVSKLAKQLAYPDFPRTADILTIIRIESGFNPKARNSISNGIMQVNYGPFDVRENMRRGVALLREYYLITHSVMGAVKSYNIGIGNYLNGQMHTAANDYWGKFMSQLRSYEEYAALPERKLNLSLTCLGCTGYLASLKKDRVCYADPPYIKEDYLSSY